MNNNDAEKEKTRNILWWAGIIASALYGLFPVAIILWIIKRYVVDGKKNKPEDNERNARAVTFKKMAQGQQSVSLEMMASVAGISYESVLREVQQLVNANYFGSGAYINYVDKTLVLPDTAAAAGSRVNIYSAGAQPHVIKTPTGTGSAGPNVTVDYSAAHAGRPAAQPGAAPQASQPKPKKIRNYYKGLCAMLGGVGALLAFIGFIMVSDAFDVIGAGLTAGRAMNLLRGGFFLGGAAVCFWP
jgi:hypothetical protein